MKGEETRYLDAARRLLPTSHGGTATGFGSSWLSPSERSQVRHLLERVEDLQELQIRAVREFRYALYSSGLDEAQWPVKPTADDAPRALDPDVSGAAQLYLAWARLSSSVGLTPGSEERARSWAARASY
jgi:hypothetical protein